jgi:hypothetical protein
MIKKFFKNKSIIKASEIMDKNTIYKYKILCEPQLSKKDLYS